MKYKGLIIVLFLLATIGFVGGFYQYRQKLDENLNKVIVQDNSLDFYIEPEEEEKEPVDTDDAIKAPNLIGVTREEALETVKTYNLKSIILEEYSGIYDEDIVFWQSLSPTIPLDDEATISFAVSLGQEEGEDPVGETITVPNLIGMNEDEAASKLVAKGFKVDYEYKENSDYDEGVVYSQNYKVAAEVAKGTVVTIRVSIKNN